MLHVARHIFMFMLLVQIILRLTKNKMTVMDQFAEKRESVKSIHKEPLNIFYWVVAVLEVMTAGTVIVALLYAIFPFKFL